MANEKIPDDFTGIITSPDGTKSWYKNGKLHREDGPAIEWVSGSKHWYIEGLKHRTDGPAMEDSDGYRCWYFEGKRHRIDGPAVRWPNGGLEWWVDGRRLRIEIDLTYCNFRKEKGKYGIEWLKLFRVEDGRLEGEYPLIPNYNYLFRRSSYHLDDFSDTLTKK